MKLYVKMQYPEFRLKSFATPLMCSALCIAFSLAALRCGLIPEGYGVAVATGRPAVVAAPHHHHAAAQGRARPR